MLAMPALAEPPKAAPASLPPSARAKGPPLAESVRLAQAAVAACAAKGYPVTALVTDSAGDPVVLLSGDGASLLSQKFAPIKVAVVLKYKVPSGEVAARARTDPALAAQIKADPKIGMALPGAVPLKRGAEFLGVFAVSGAAGADMDASCVQAALARVRPR